MDRHRQSSRGPAPEPSEPLLDREAMWRVLVDSLDVWPDAELIERGDWVQLRTPSSRAPNHNKVLRARISEAEADARIAAVLAEHAARGAGLMWVVDEDSRPADLSARLLAAGVPSVGAGLGMVRAVEPPPYPPAPPGVRVVRAGPHDCERLGEITSAGWGRPAAFGRVAADLARRAFRGRVQGLAFWLAYDGDQLVGTSTLRVLPGLGYLQGAAVVPRARGRGIYRQLTWVRIAELHRRGIPRVVVWADPETSAPVVRAMGFEAVTQAHFHELDGASP